MTFCPRCGASLKGAPEPQAAPVPPYQKRNEKAEKDEKNEKQEKNESREKQEKGERGFIGYLIGGLILITLGLFSVIQISNPNMINAGQTWALMLLIIGVIIIAGAIYVAVIARKHSPVPH
jgi:cation transport ATPase